MSRMPSLSESLAYRGKTKEQDLANALALQSQAGEVDMAKQKLVNAGQVDTTGMNNRTQLAVADGSNQTALATNKLNNSTEIEKTKMAGVNNLANTELQGKNSLATQGAQNAGSLAVQGLHNSGALALQESQNTQQSDMKRADTGLELVKLGYSGNDAQSSTGGIGRDRQTAINLSGLAAKTAPATNAFTHIQPIMDPITGKMTSPGSILNQQTGAVTPDSGVSPNESTGMHVQALGRLDQQHKVTYMQALKLSNPAAYAAVMLQMKQPAQ